jgi:cob(I)alamin adenosyltransferase
MKIYTKVGDKGKTHLFGCCGMVSKDDARIEAVGALDELNSVIGVSLNFVDNDLKVHLKKIQNDLFQVGADLASGQEYKVPRINTVHVDEMEQRIDHIFSLLSEQKEFILPGGTIASSFLHLSRSIARRAERNLVKVSNTINLNPELLRYVNRLSDLLFALARQANENVNVKEQHPLYDYMDG